MTFHWFDLQLTMGGLFSRGSGRRVRPLLRVFRHVRRLIASEQRRERRNQRGGRRNQRRGQNWWRPCSWEETRLKEASAVQHLHILLLKTKDCEATRSIRWRNNLGGSKERSHGSEESHVFNDQPKLNERQISTFQLTFWRQLTWDLRVWAPGLLSVNKTFILAQK